MGGSRACSRARARLPLCRIMQAAIGMIAETEAGVFDTVLARDCAVKSKTLSIYGRLSRNSAVLCSACLSGVATRAGVCIHPAVEGIYTEPSEEAVIPVSTARRPERINQAKSEP